MAARLPRCEVLQFHPAFMIEGQSYVRAATGKGSGHIDDGSTIVPVPPAAVADVLKPGLRDCAGAQRGRFRQLKSLRGSGCALASGGERETAHAGIEVLRSAIAVPCH